MTKVTALLDDDGVLGLYVNRAAAVVALGEGVLAGTEYAGVYVEEFEIQGEETVVDLTPEVAAAELTRELQTVYIDTRTYDGVPFLYDSDGDRWERNEDGTYSCEIQGVRHLHYNRVANLFGPLATTDPTATELTRELQTVYDDTRTYNGVPFLYDSDGDRWVYSEHDRTYTCPDQNITVGIDYIAVEKLHGPLSTTDRTTA